MRRSGNLWEQVTSFENLHRAFYQVLRGKRGKPRAGDFFADLENNLFLLQKELRDHSYVPGDYHTFWVSEPKPRLISAAPMRDRVVHHALVDVIEPIFERRFFYHSYACRKDKGTHRALKKFVTWARSSHYVLKMDIHKFFPTIDHEILKERIWRAIKDPEALRLCNLIIDHSNDQERVVQYFPEDDLFTPVFRRKGIPIGNLTSQFFANVYLDALDHYVKERLRIKRYLRYVDDFCIFHDDKGFLREIRCRVAEFLVDLRQTLNEGKSRVRQAREGIEFLGFVVFPERLRLNQTAVRRQRRRIKRLQQEYAAGEIDWPKVKESLQAWNAHACYGTTWQLRRDVFQKAIFIRSGPKPPFL